MTDLEWTTTTPGREPALHVNYSAVDGAWKSDGIEPAPETTSITYNAFHADRSPPIVILPVENLPKLRHVTFYNLSISSIDEVQNLDQYRKQMERIDFHECRSLVIDDLSWFVEMDIVKDICIMSCQLRSLRYLDQFSHPVELIVTGNDMELSNEIETIEAYWRNNGAKQRNCGKLGIEHNLIRGKKVLNGKWMTTASAIGYIRGWMAKRPS